MTQKRVFFALWPDADSRHQLDLINDRFIHSGRRLSLENLHITLFFVGQISDDQLHQVCQRVDKIRAQPILLRFDELDCWKPPAVLCLTCQKQTMPLYDLVNQLTQVMRAFPVRIETRPYRAHITLARKVKQKPAEPAWQPVEMRFDEFMLVESISTENGVIYQPIQRWSLGAIDEINQPS